MELLDKDLRSLQETRNLIAKAKKAQEIYKTFSQEKVDSIVKAITEAVEKEAVKLAKMAHEETGFGKWEDKIIKNTFASRGVYESIKDLKTVGIINENKEKKYFEVGVPVGVVAGLIPSTNPTSTTIYKTLISLKSGNAIVISPHPNAVKCIVETSKILNEAAIKAGAPEGLIGCITVPSLQGTSELMKHKDTALILATGGEAMVKAAYSSGTPAIGVGPGNGPAFIDKSTNVKLAVKRILDSKTFDNGVICASEQSIVVENSMKETVKEELIKQGAYFLNEEESEKLGKFILRANGTMNPMIVGKSVEKLSEMSGLNVKKGSRVLISEQTTVGKNNPYSREKLTPILAFYTVNDVEEGIKLCTEILMNEGKGHTLVLHSEDNEVIKNFGLRIPVSRLLVNVPGALGGLGAATNLTPALTLGCGAVGGSSTSDNIGPMNLLNIRRVALGVKELEDLRGNENTESNETLNTMSKEQLELVIKKVVEQLSRLS
ncbi:acetaldehyde dehydrogenase (acetylating) [Clostridium tetani]|uniref:acetaldehyde dehydrogenase (acetylating) n=1 Tax=Clostridium tetani TaxID=1513 RepID=UPI00100BF844|nr:acetaldehyde dehydrogenase (acetylating) [Clostridium tetani]RXI53750.1 acetaldehyde dehydrogenase (acetylating) [Clostridium tetani]RXI54680.1 acetaldehyde dehydrogenase (acetylating) [Clostridium tetani]RXM70399.1 acetaldehyde dehydrogenase (acetylating) [Clostridium tetani]BDR70536.1 acetaldehyde dehydrogenase (acetylating) [Clostridium tetani]BDR73402.1 acetaldehyde dehydrogenase (acetylating) [Clostridium tetani]